MKEFGIRKICMHVHFVYMYMYIRISPEAVQVPPEAANFF